MYTEKRTNGKSVRTNNGKNGTITAEREEKKMYKLYYVYTNGYNMLVSDDGEIRRVLTDDHWDEMNDMLPTDVLDAVEDDSSWEEYSKTVDELTDDCTVLAVRDWANDRPATPENIDKWPEDVLEEKGFMTDSWDDNPEVIQRLKNWTGLSDQAIRAAKVAYKAAKGYAPDAVDLYMAVDNDTISVWNNYGRTPLVWYMELYVEDPESVCVDIDTLRVWDDDEVAAFLELCFEERED